MAGVRVTRPPSSARSNVDATVSEETASDWAWLFEGEDGEVHSFASEDAWRAAVDADLRLRELEG